MDRAAVILAAGKGTRMKSDRTKVLHSVGGRIDGGLVAGACGRAGVLDAGCWSWVPILMIF